MSLRARIRTAGRHRLARTFARAFTRFAPVFAVLLAVLFLPIQWSRTDADRDAVAYYLAAERIETGRSMYEPYPPPGPHIPNTGAYLYPPFLATAIAVLPTAPWPWFARAWLLVVMAAFVVFAAALCRLVTGRVELGGSLVAVAALGLTPGVMHALNMGQADVLVWAGIGLALAFPSMRGAGLAIAAMIKVFPVWALLTAAVREPRRTIPTAFAVIGAGTLLAVAVLGPAGFVAECGRWFRYVAPSLSQGQFSAHSATVWLWLPFGFEAVPLPALAPANLSLSFAPILLARELGWWEYGGGALPSGLRVYLGVIAVGAPTAAAWLLRRRPPLAHCAGVLAASVLFAPVLRLSYLPVLIAAALAFRRASPFPGTACRGVLRGHDGHSFAAK